MQLIKMTLSKTDQSRGNSIVVSYRKAQIISNHLAQLYAMLAGPTKLSVTNSNLLTTEHKKEQNYAIGVKSTVC